MTIFQESDIWSDAGKLIPSRVRRYYSGYKSFKTKPDGRTDRRIDKTGKRRTRLSEIKFEIFQTKIEWIWHKTDENGIGPLQDKLLAKRAQERLENEKELKSFLGAIQ